MSIQTALYDRIAQRLLAAHPAPDLSDIILLLPNYHVAQPLAQALLRVAQRPVLLPRMVTLNDWAQSVPLAGEVMPDSQRTALLYQHLRKQKWFGDADLWGMAQELVSLFDQLTHAVHTLPSDAEAFVSAIQQAYQARENTALQLEARLVFELWYAMQSGAELDAARAYQQRLAVLAAQGQHALYVLRTSAWDALEQRFLEECAQHAVVKVFDLREMEAVPRLPRFFAASSLEQEARAAAMQVRCWLNEGKRDIAIVAQDRVAARRLRALLERAQIWVEDESGWTLATLAVSTVLERWLTALQSDFYHIDLLDLLKSPFIFFDLPAGTRKALVYRLEQRLRKQGVVAGLENFSELSAGDADLQSVIQRLQQAATLLQTGRSKTLAEWLAALRSSLDVLGIVEGLQQDAAGQQLLQSLQTWQQELQPDGGRYRFAEWRRWLAQQLDTATFRDGGVESRVRFTHLAATRWRGFDAVMLLGCDAEHLPSVADGGRWFNDGVRNSLGLPTRSFHATRQRDDLLALLTLHDTVLVTWQKEHNGEARLLSPYLQILCDEYGREPGEEHALLALLAAEEVQAVSLPPQGAPAPLLDEAIVPETVSISAYNTLIACPYQFYARHVLRLNELDEVQETIEKRDYGERVHAILQRFHERYAVVSGNDRAQMESVLREISMTVFADLLAHDFAARAWLTRWYQALPAYLEWQAKTEAEGWRYAAAEREFAVPLPGVRLRGRIDRLDTRGEEQRVLDYKLQSAQALRGKLQQPGEDVQLASYVYAAGADEAVFVSIESAQVNAIAPKQDMHDLAQLNARRLAQVMADVRGGAGLPANGAEAVCGYCEMRGLCRKGEW